MILDFVSSVDDSRMDLLLSKTGFNVVEINSGKYIRLRLKAVFGSRKDAAGYLLLHNGSRLLSLIHFNEDTSEWIREYDDDLL